MSYACAMCHARLAAIAAGRASEADRLEVETHLGDCPDCCAEEARWGVIAKLAAWEPSLSPAARERVRATALAEALPRRRREAPARTRRWTWMAASVAAALVAAMATAELRGGPRPGPGDDARVVAGEVILDGRAVGAGTPIGAAARVSVGPRGGTLLLAGPRLELLPDTRIAWSRGVRTVTLERGAVRVDVDPGQGRRFRVATSRFTAEVVGTRFTVSLDSVRTERGKVRVRAAGGQEVAMVGAGETWSLPIVNSEATPAARAGSPGAARSTGAGTSAPLSQPAAQLEPAVAPAVAAATPQPPGTPRVAPISTPGGASPPLAPMATARTRLPAPPLARTAAARANPFVGPRHVQTAEAKGVDSLLEAARHANSRGDASQARALLRQVLAMHPDAALVAEADWLLAESFLAEEQRGDDAIKACRQFQRAHPALPQAENASFLIPQLELEAGRKDEARRGFAEYLARYPEGRFRVEAATLLEQLAPTDPDVP